MLGDPQVAEAVAALVRTWQQPRQQMVEAARARQQAERNLRWEHRQTRRRLQELAGGGRRRRGRIGRLYDQAVQRGTRAEMAFLLRREYVRPDPPRGRPCKGGLVLLG